MAYEDKVVSIPKEDWEKARALLDDISELAGKVQWDEASWDIESAMALLKMSDDY